MGRLADKNIHLLMVVIRFAVFGRSIGSWTRRSRLN